MHVSAALICIPSPLLTSSIDRFCIGSGRRWTWWLVFCMLRLEFSSLAPCCRNQRSERPGKHSGLCIGLLSDSGSVGYGRLSNRWWPSNLSSSHWVACHNDRKSLLEYEVFASTSDGTWPGWWCHPSSVMRGESPRTHHHCGISAFGRGCLCKGQIISNLSELSVEHQHQRIWWRSCSYQLIRGSTYSCLDLMKIKVPHIRPWKFDTADSSSELRPRNFTPAEISRSTEVRQEYILYCWDTLFLGHSVYTGRLKNNLRGNLLPETSWM